MSEAGAGRAKRSPKLRNEFRIIRDFVIGLVVYAGIVLATSFADGGQFDVQPTMFSSTARAAAPTGLVPAGATAVAAESQLSSTEKREAVAILGLAFAALVAFDLALFRHLRRVYASPR